MCCGMIQYVILTLRYKFENATAMKTFTQKDEDTIVIAMEEAIPGTVHDGTWENRLFQLPRNILICIKAN